MKLGFLQVYNEVNWVGYAIDQATVMCDKLLIMEGSQFVAFPDIPERSTDGTLDVISDKSKQYGKRITCLNTTRKHGNYMRNQCDNFNRAITYCDIGDYFIQLDADEFHFDEWIAEANNLMREGKADLIKALNYEFAFSFNWRFEHEKQRAKPVIIKKTEKPHFTRFHSYINPGENVIVIPGIGYHHYTWVKPPERILIRMRTSEMYNGMVEWFKQTWLKMKPEDGKTYQTYSGKLTFHRYSGPHPPILKYHPWRDIDDVRKI